MSDMFYYLADPALSHLTGQGRFGAWDGPVQDVVDGSQNLRHTQTGETLRIRAMASETGAAGDIGPDYPVL